VLVKRPEDVSRDTRVVLSGGARETVVGDSEIPQILANEPVVALGDLMRRDAFPVRRDHHRRAVLVGPAHH